MVTEFILREFKVCLRWVYQQGVSFLVKSYNEQRMKENMMFFHWELTEDELENISKIPQRKGVLGDKYVSELEARFDSIRFFYRYLFNQIMKRNAQIGHCPHWFKHIAGQHKCSNKIDTV